MLKTSNFSFCHHFFNSIQLLFFHLRGFSVLLPTRYEIPLLQISCMWERVKSRLLPICCIWERSDRALWHKALILSDIPFSTASSLFRSSCCFFSILSRTDLRWKQPSPRKHNKNKCEPFNKYDIYYYYNIIYIS